MNPLCLEQLTISDVPPPELVSIAATIGCQAVSLYMLPFPHGFEVLPLIGDTPVRRETARRCAETGVEIRTLEGFPIQPDTDIETFAAALESGAWLGGRQVTTSIYGLAKERALDRFTELCVLARSMGLKVNIEFLRFSSIRNLEEAVWLVTRAAQPNAGIVIDSLHLMRSGGAPADVAQLDPGLIGWVHFVDGPLLAVSDEPYIFEAVHQRHIPGEGQFPLREFLDALPPEIMISVEIPLKNLRDQGVPPLQRARLAVEATQRILRTRAVG